MKISKLATLFIVFMCSFQMAFAQTLENSRIIASQPEISEVLRELAFLKKSLRGNVSNKLSDDQMNQFAEMFKQQAASQSAGEASSETEFMTFLGELKKNSCRTKDYNEDPVAKKEPAAIEKRGDSLFTGLSEEIAKIELDESVDVEITERMKFDYSKAVSYFNRAKKLKTHIENIINNSNESYEDKEQLLLAYNDSIIKGLHDIKVILKPFINTSQIQIDQIIPRLSTNFLEEETELYNILVHGEVTDKIFFKVEFEGDFAIVKLNSFYNAKRDIVTINESPSGKNYLYALRLLTIQMMASQIKNYDVMIDSLDSPVVIPRSCRTRQNGSWPEMLKLKVDPSLSEAYLENLMKNMGLSYDEANLELMSVREAQEINPLSDTMIASTSVENFLRSESGKEAKNYPSRLLRAGFDEVEAYQKYIDMKMGQVMQLYRDDVYYSKGGRARGKKKVTRKDFTLISDIIGSVPENKTIKVDIFEMGEKYEEDIYPAAMNASPYIASKLASARTEKLEDIISSELKNKLQANKIKVAFPSLNSQEAFRNWAINALQEKIIELKDDKEYAPGSKNNNMLISYCNHRVGSICSGVSRNKSFLDRVSNYIDTLKLDGKYLPVSRLNTREVAQNYLILASVFYFLRDNAKVFPELITNEYDYLLGQMQALNPLAKVRLGYLIAREELTSIKNGQVKKMKKTARGMRVDYSYTCFNNSMTNYIERLDEAAEELMVDRPIEPDFLTRYMKKDEYVALWNNIYDKYNKDTTQIFTAKLRTGKKAFQMVDELASKVTIDRNQIESAASDLIQDRLMWETEQKLDKRLQEEDVEKIAFYKEILAAKSHKERQAIFESRPSNIDIFDDYELVHNFMKLNADLKAPVYMEILKKSAQKRQKETYAKLNAFCQIDENDIDSLKENFFATVKVQDQLNQLLGIPAVPQELMDRMGDWSSDEKWAMYNGIFGFLLGMGAVLAAGSCTILTGGLCGLAIAGAGAIGFGMQANAIRLETKVKFRADDSEEYVGQMADLGFTDSNATENVARGWMAVAFEVIGTLSMISILTRSISVGSKIFKESLKAIVKNRAKLGIKEALKQSGKSASVIVNESEVEFAKLVLGLKKYKDVFKNLVSSKSIDDIATSLKNLDLGDDFVESTLKKLDKIEANYRAGKLTKSTYDMALKDIVKKIETALTKANGGIYRYTSDVAVNLTYKNVDDALGQTVAKLFNGSPLQLRNYMGSYVKRLNSGWFRKSSEAARARLRMMKASQGRYMKGTNWIVRAWSENTANLAKNRAKFLKIYDQLQRLPEAELADFIAKNADDLTEIFVKIPLRKRDMPFMLLQGMPHTGGFFGRRLPVLSEIGEGVLIKKIFTSRARLISEVARKSAREALGLKRVLMAETVGDLYKGLDVSLSKAMTKMPQAEAKEAQAMLVKVKKQIVDSVTANLDSDRAVRNFMKNNNIDLSEAAAAGEEALKAKVTQLLYAPNGETEHAFAKYLWASADVKSLFKAPEFEGLAYKVMKETIEEENIGSLQHYLNALKILQVSDNGALGSIEIF